MLRARAPGWTRKWGVDLSSSGCRGEAGAERVAVRRQVGRLGDSQHVYANIKSIKQVLL